MPAVLENAEAQFRCPTCKSYGFLRSAMFNRCSFCDGTTGGHPPDQKEIDDWNNLKSDEAVGYDPCDCQFNSHWLLQAFETDYYPYIADPSTNNQ